MFVRALHLIRPSVAVEEERVNAQGDAVLRMSTTATVLSCSGESQPTSRDLNAKQNIRAEPFENIEFHIFPFHNNHQNFYYSWDFRVYMAWNTAQYNTSTPLRMGIHCWFLPATSRKWSQEKLLWVEPRILCLTLQALCHEDVWFTGCIDPHSLDLVTSWWHAPAALPPVPIG
jgi:hypothetical protein